LKFIYKVILVVFVLIYLPACDNPDAVVEIGNTSTPELPSPIITSTQTQTPTSTLKPPKALSICSQEPASLFLYGDTTSASRSVLQAIYDGPIDLYNFKPQAVILNEIPSLENGGVSLQIVDVAPGGLIVDAEGQWVSLNEGVIYKPAGCNDSSCALTFEGVAPVQMDAMVVVFNLLPDVKWSDGNAMVAEDSVFSFWVFEHLYRSTYPDILKFTKSYTALDEQTVEWVGIPGYMGSIASKFFSPLPGHLWGEIGIENLFSSEISSKKPIGWGPYIIDEWVAGDHITLNRNPNYYRVVEDLPHFDHVVYRFMQDGDEAIDALLIGECDFIDRTLLTEAHIPRLQAGKANGLIDFSIQTGTAWELAVFGIESLDEQVISMFRQKEVRRAVGMCIDRQKIVDELLFGISTIPDTYVPLNHPLYTDDGEKIEFDPEMGGEILESAGWIDQDSDPTTPRASLGVEGIPDGTLFKFTYLVPSDAERPEAAGMVKNNLAACGIEVEVVVEEWDILMEPGPEGLLFGRRFEMAQFAWAASVEPSCTLFIASEIPGPYPEYSKGWGGGNLSGYTSPEFDANCTQAVFSLPGSVTNIKSHKGAQEIFSSDLPAIPLYQRVRLAAFRPDICNLVIDPAANSALSNLELLDSGENCD